MEMAGVSVVSPEMAMLGFCVLMMVGWSGLLIGSGMRVGGEWLRDRVRDRVRDGDGEWFRSKRKG